MNSRARLTTVSPAAVLFLTALALFGCSKSPNEDDASTHPTPKTVAFKGKVDPRYAGNWRTKDGNSTLNLGKAGDAVMETTSFSQSGKNVTRVVGNWLVDGTHLNLQYSAPNNEIVKMQYSAELSGNTLKLAQFAGRLKTEYTRK